MVSTSVVRQMFFFFNLLIDVGFVVFTPGEVMNANQQTLVSFYKGSCL